NTMLASAYSYSAMANYAKSYAYSYNPAYRSFPNDCTNFISQAMSFGGWSMVGGFYTLNSAWWYNSIHQSYTWAGAENWYWFARGSGRTSYLSNVWYMLLADVLQVDFDRNGNINHTMIVTTVGSSDLYITYHSTNTRDRSLRSFITQFPNAWYYAHRT
ncbi:amidase domain-containing protein, partial [Methylovulum sp.]